MMPMQQTRMDTHMAMALRALEITEADVWREYFALRPDHPLGCLQCFTLGLTRTNASGDRDGGRDCPIYGGETDPGDESGGACVLRAVTT